MGFLWLHTEAFATSGHFENRWGAEQWPGGDRKKTYMELGPRGRPGTQALEKGVDVVLSLSDLRYQPTPGYDS